MKGLQRLWSVRGATTLEKRNSAHMIERVGALLCTLFDENAIAEGATVNIQFTQTPDIDFLNAAAAARASIFGTKASKIPLLCSREPDYPESLPLTVRIMVTYYHSQDHEPRPVYPHGAQVLREDLTDVQSD